MNMARKKFRNDSVIRESRHANIYRGIDLPAGHNQVDHSPKGNATTMLLTKKLFALNVISDVPYSYSIPDMS